MNTIIINKLLMHMLDVVHNQIFFSNQFVELNDTNLEYYHTKLDKAFYNSNVKKITVGSMHELVLRCQNMLKSDEEFIHQATEITNALFNLSKKIEDMPNSNLIFADCYKEGVHHLAILKINYRTIPMSIIEDGVVKISEAQVLPAKSARIEEAILVNLETKELFLIEKKFTVDGRLSYYLNDQWIKGEVALTDQQKYNSMKKVINKVDQVYAVNDGSSLPMLKQSISEKLELKEPIKPLEIVKKVLERDYNASEESEILLNDLGISNEDEITTISIPSIDTCKMVLDGDKVLSLPVDEYLNGHQVVKTQNEDGTYEIKISNINEIIVK